MSKISIDLHWQSGLLFNAKIGSHELKIDGPPAIGGTDSGIRPMQLMLAGIASCSVMEAMLIANKAKIEFSDFTLHVDGQRAEEIPARFTSINLDFDFKAPKELTATEIKKTINAVTLSVTKYCSAVRSLHEDITIKFRLIVNGQDIFSST